MKTVKYLVNLVIIPLGVLLFVSVGIIAALISAGIEYSVLKQLFLSVSENPNHSEGIALLLVISFEFTKIFLHFYHKRAQQHVPEINRRNVLIGAKSLITALVVFSFICSVIFTVSTLYLPAYSEETVKAEITAVKDKLEADVRAVEQKYWDEYEKEMEPYNAEVKKYTDAITNALEQGKGPKTTEVYMGGVSSELEKARIEQQKAAVRLARERDKKIQEEKQKLEAEAQLQIEALTDTSSPEVAAQYDNPILADFLTVLTNALFGGKTYSRGAYLWVSVMLGLIVAALLEAIISFSMQFLSTPLDFLADNMDDVNAKIKHWCGTMVVTVFKAFGAVAVYIVILFFVFSSSPEKEKIWLGLLVCTLSILLTRKYVPGHSDGEMREQIIYGIRDCILQGVVSLMGYILLGFVFGSDALRLDINAAAVGIGSVLSGGIVQLPHFLLQANNTTTN